MSDNKCVLELKYNSCSDSSSDTDLCCKSIDSNLSDGSPFFGESDNDTDITTSNNLVHRCLIMGDTSSRAQQSVYHEKNLDAPRNNNNTFDIELTRGSLIQPTVSDEIPKDIESRNEGCILLSKKQAKPSLKVRHVVSIDLSHASTTINRLCDNELRKKRPRRSDDDMDSDWSPYNLNRVKKKQSKKLKTVDCGSRQVLNTNNFQGREKIENWSIISKSM
ncbi:hypothetical protein QAD02_007155 [Eretmocerus hayati]|uniref:Uncharacterized protein n=1 Tax=Eretmocerus hayati TaxID=131215 RepID=A0ACC2N430_9HYME|nr:hypothetical protein QAD02_007155 [Eretmocerus hayati]